MFDNHHPVFFGVKSWLVSTSTVCTWCFFVAVCGFFVFVFLGGSSFLDDFRGFGCLFVVLCSLCLRSDVIYDTQIYYNKISSRTCHTGHSIEEFKDSSGAMLYGLRGRVDQHVRGLLSSTDRSRSGVLVLDDVGGR